MSDESNGPILPRAYRRQVERRMTDLDSKYLDPTERAEMVYTLLFKIIPHEEKSGHVFLGETWWDLFCFASSFIAHAAQGLDDAQLLGLARALNGWTHSAHYSSDGLFDASRANRTRFWMDLIDTLSSPPDPAPPDEKEDSSHGL